MTHDEWWASLLLNAGRDYSVLDVKRFTKKAWNAASQKSLCVECGSEVSGRFNLCVNCFQRLGKKCKAEKMNEKDLHKFGEYCWDFYKLGYKRAIKDLQTTIQLFENHKKKEFMDYILKRV
jgi:predicted amidophosphoribosyltransferase